MSHVVDKVTLSTGRTVEIQVPSFRQMREHWGKGSSEDPWMGLLEIAGLCTCMTAQELDDMNVVDTMAILGAIKPVTDAIVTSIQALAEYQNMQSRMH